MDFDLQWLLIGLPIAFAFGWIASRIDIGQWKRAQREAPKAYFQGLNLLLNEQHDKAIDAFIEAVQRDPDTADLHFALGNLFRRRGEFERAVRVHQHLLQRADLGAADRARAQHALAQDFVKAGLLDRAEQAYRELEGTDFDIESRLARLSLAERARDWRTAAEVAARLEASGTGSYASRIAHHWCELSLQASDAGDPNGAADALRRAREAAPHAPRPLIVAARLATQKGDAAGAFMHYTELLQHAPGLFPLVASDYATAAIGSGQVEAARATIERRMKEQPSVDLLHAMRLLDGALPTQPTVPDVGERAQSLLHVQPTLSAALAVLDAPMNGNDEQALRDVREAVALAARPLQRYRCAACGFEAPQHFWQCPGCLSWDTFPAQRIEEL
ncbi:MAG: lipopolysaccharide assembly protein LapB [Burkholderiaceae bacterium]|nr:lipopolysaccharide assembly protein LapB [Burkholderiaceae bacterium]